MKTARRVCAFTLIELLIVIAIIAILALIAIPNFLEAQTRSKVSRAHADMRTLKTGLAAYYVDQNAYPVDKGINDIPTYAQMTTPVGYITTIPQDPFFDRAHRLSHGLPPSLHMGFYVYAGPWSSGPNFAAGVGYHLHSAGPNNREDAMQDEPTYDNCFGDGPRGIMVKYIYDPTNGTISYGDILVTAKDNYN